MPILLGLLALIILVPLAVVYFPGHKSRLEKIFSIPAQQAIDFSTLRKTKKPNQYLVCPVNLCAETPDLVAPVYPVSVESLAKAWHSMVMAEPDVMAQSQDSSNLTQYYVQRTKRMRYPDLIAVRFIAAEGGQSTIAVYSRSVYGHGDAGVNKARVTDWLAKLNEAVKR